MQEIQLFPPLGHYPSLLLGFYFWWQVSVNIHFEVLARPCWAHTRPEDLPEVIRPESLSEIGYGLKLDLLAVYHSLDLDYVCQLNVAPPLASLAQL